MTTPVDLATLDAGMAALRDLGVLVISAYTWVLGGHGNVERIRAVTPIVDPDGLLNPRQAPRRVIPIASPYDPPCHPRTADSTVSMPHAGRSPDAMPCSRGPARTLRGVLGGMFELPDGRLLCFDDVGDPTGAPVLYLHGTPDSRRARHPDDDVNARAGVRLIAVDRPGFGASSAHPDGTVGSFADDAAALAHHLGIPRWAVLGWSAGAVHALAVAARHPALVTAVGIVAGLPPAAAYATPGILEEAGDDRRAVAELAAEMPPADVGALLAPLVAPWPCDLDLAREYVLERADDARRRELDAVPGALDAMATGVVDAVAQGLAGLEHDIALQTTPPDIELGDVVCPVRLWYGALDSSAPPAFGHWLAAHLPGATLDVIDDAGHCLILPRWAEILQALIPPEC